MYQSVLYGEHCVSEELLWKNCPAEELGNIDYLLDVIDWEENTDKNFAQKHFMQPLTIWEDECGKEEWICYKCSQVCAKRLTIYPQKTKIIKDMAAYGLILIQGHGTLGRWPIETPTLIRYGDLTNDEFFVSAGAAEKGIAVRNLSNSEPLVMLKHFAENPERNRLAELKLFS